MTPPSGNTPITEPRTSCTIDFKPKLNCDLLPSSKPGVCSWHRLTRSGRNHVAFHQLDCLRFVQEKLPISKLDSPGFHYEANASTCHSDFHLNKPTLLQRTLRVGCVCKNGATQSLLCAFDVPREGEAQNVFDRSVDINK